MQHAKLRIGAVDHLVGLFYKQTPALYLLSRRSESHVTQNTSWWPLRSNISRILWSSGGNAHVDVLPQRLHVAWPYRIAPLVFQTPTRRSADDELGASAITCFSSAKQPSKMQLASDGRAILTSRLESSVPSKGGIEGSLVC